MSVERASGGECGDRGELGRVLRGRGEAVWTVGGERRIREREE